MIPAMETGLYELGYSVRELDLIRLLYLGHGNAHSVAVRWGVSATAVWAYHCRLRKKGLLQHHSLALTEKGRGVFLAVREMWV